MEPPVILIVDDEPDIRDLFQSILDREPYHLVFAENGEEGLARFKETSPTLVLLDLRMPVMDGLEMLRQLQPRPDDPYAVIVLTGHGDDEEVRQCYQLGIHAFLRKPSHIDEFRGLVKQSLALKQAERKTREHYMQLIQAAKLASLGELVTGIAHELNQPLQAISLTTERILKHVLAPADPQNIRPSLKTIIRQVNYASQIITHLRKFGRSPEALPKEKVPINTIIEESFILFNEQLRLLNIQVLKELAAALPLVACYPLQIEQILTNLLSNARDAVKTSVKKILTIRSFQEGDWILVEVADTGCGIAENIRERIFDPFFTTKAVGEGTGLGLSIAYGIMREHGGKITVASEVDKGSVFRLAFPLS